ncbi:MAG: hypothetical protein ABL995_06320 [Bryobacteraceae bacterium]
MRPFAVAVIVCWVTPFLVAAQLAVVAPFDLVRNYQLYDGKRISIEGDIASGPEMTVMYLGVQNAANDPNGMLILMSESVSRHPSKVEKRFNAALKKKGRVHAVVEGYFNGSEDRQWGHQLCCRFKLRIDKIVSVR